MGFYLYEYESCVKSLGEVQKQCLHHFFFLKEPCLERGLIQLALSMIAVTLRLECPSSGAAHWSSEGGNGWRSCYLSQCRCSPPQSQYGHRYLFATKGLADSSGRKWLAACLTTQSKIIRLKNTTESLKELLVLYFKTIFISNATKQHEQEFSYAMGEKSLGSNVLYYWLWTNYFTFLGISFHVSNM